MRKSLGAKTVVYPTPVFIIGTYDKNGKANAMTVAWGGICCSKPPCISISLRKATYSYNNIIARKAFSINIPSEEFVKEADYFGIVSGRNTDKFITSGLTPVNSDLVDAPYIEEFPLIIECKLIRTVNIGLHTQFIGEILDVKYDITIEGDNKLPDIKKAKPIIFAPDTRIYYSIGEALGQAFSIGKELIK